MPEILQLSIEEIQKDLEDKLQRALGASFIERVAAYSLKAPCKRIRPLLMLLSSNALGINFDKVWAPAIALEMIHTYSLIHDDLPCMDDDNLRRGQAACHKVYGDAMALLGGDYLLTHAFEILANARYLQSEEKVQLTALFAEKAGALGMIGGQVMDLQAERRQLPIEKIQRMYEMKTASLFELAFETSAILAKKDRDKMQELGRVLGLCFQISDDILDLTSSEESLGKPQGSDLKKEKSTYVQALGLTQAKETAQELHKRASKLLEELFLEATLLHKLCDKIIKRI